MRSSSYVDHNLVESESSDNYSSCIIFGYVGQQAQPGLVDREDPARDVEDGHPRRQWVSFELLLVNIRYFDEMGGHMF